MTIKPNFKRKQTLHSNLSEKKALFTDINHAGREKPGVYFPKFLLKSVTIKPNFKRKQTLHSNLSEKKALFTDIDHAGREKPGVYFPGNMFSKPSAWS